MGHGGGRQNVLELENVHGRRQAQWGSWKEFERVMGAGMHKVVEREKMGKGIGRRQAECDSERASECLYHQRQEAQCDRARDCASVMGTGRHRYVRAGGCVWVKGQVGSM